MKSARSFFANTPLFARIGALYFVVVALIVGSVFLTNTNSPAVYALETPVALQQQAQKAAAAAPNVSGMPVRLDVSRVDLSLNVKPGSYDRTTKEWTLDTTNAFFATNTQQPGTAPGTTFLYGHNRASAFGPLASITVGDTASVTVESGATLVYEYARDIRVSPEFTQVMNEPSDIPQLVLMTCEGLFSDVRRIMYFTLKEVR